MEIKEDKSFFQIKSWSKFKICFNTLNPNIFASKISNTRFESILCLKFPLQGIICNSIYIWNRHLKSTFLIMRFHCFIQGGLARFRQVMKSILDGHEMMNVSYYGVHDKVLSTDNAFCIFCDNKRNTEININLEKSPSPSSFLEDENEERFRRFS